jgi:cyclopropane fatty-acyl-phospholipid synthase-like methyltransferase
MLKKGETLLDIGCGWGTLARHAVSEYKAVATGVTLSREGKIYCDMASEKTGIKTEILHCDYRLIPQDRKFDKISSIEMAEHVGIKNFVDPYLTTVRRLLKNKDSMFLMQVAGLRQGSNWQDVQWGLFMGKYVFPGADASTPLNWYVKQCELAGFEVHSVENIGIHYSHTLHKWYDNWMSHKEEILSGKIDAISDHIKGTRLFRLNEFTWAWCAIHAGHGGGTCYQLLMNPSEYDFPRDQWVTGKHVSNSGVTGIGVDNQFKEEPVKAVKTPKKPTRVQPSRSSKKSQRTD